MSRPQTRELRTSTPLETRHSLARCVSNYLSDDETGLLITEQSTTKKRPTSRGTQENPVKHCFGQDIEDNNKKAPRQYRPKWEYADKFRIASLSVRGMKEFAKRGQTILETVTRSIYIMCIRN